MLMMTWVCGGVVS